LCLDPSVEMIKKAKKRKMPCLRGVGVPLPIRRGLLDFSYMVTVLEFLNDPVALFKEVQLNSKKNAALSILFINSDSTWGELYRGIGEKGDPVFKHATLFSLEKVSALLNKSGYSIIDAKGTLNSDPANQEVDDRLVEPNNKCGVIIVKAV
jgi:SAM-dependent methyltransferase